MAGALLGELHARIRSSGPLPFDTYMRTVLYHPRYGYYATRVPGAGGHYGTSPALTAWYGRLVAVELRSMWGALGRPGAFTVVEAGAGRADLAAGAIEAAGDLRGALQWRFVERFDAVADLQRLRLGAAAEAAEWSRELSPAPAQGPAAAGCVLAHEVLDNFPVHVLEVAGGGEVLEVYVDEGDGGRLVERLGPLSTPVLAEPARAASAAGLPAGSRLEFSADLQAWCDDATAAIARGYLLIVDYGDVEPDLWLRNPRGTIVTYGPAGFGDDPYLDPGSVDVTADVDFSTVERAARRSGFAPELLTTQREWLQSLGHSDVARALEEAAAEEAAAGRHTEAMARYGELSELEGLVARMGLGDIMVFRAARSAPALTAAI